MSNFDHVVTQWMAPLYVDAGRAWICSHVQVVGCSTRPSTANVHDDVASLGVGSAVSTGHWLPTSYCPGGRRGSRASWLRPKNPLVNLAMPQLVAWRTASRHGAGHRGEEQIHHDTGAAPRTEVRLHSTAHGLQQFAHDGEAKAGAALFPNRLTAGHVQPLEHERKVVRRNARAV